VSRNNRRILVVEDDPDGQAVIAHILSYMNVPVDVVGDAEQADHALFMQQIPYTSVIIDLALPGKDGFALMRDIKANNATAHLPCIAVTAYHTTKLREESIKAGFDAYFPKPLEATSFVRQLEGVL